jgi:hypothetical protein
MMSLNSQRELVEVVRPRYLKAKKIEKQKMLDEFTSATGYHRKHAIRVLKNKVQVQNHLKGENKTSKTIYRGEVVQVLEQIWEIYGRICSKRLQPFLPEAIKVLEKEIKSAKDTKELLLKISSASVAHCGNTTEGQYLNTLTCTDISTGWTDVTALPRRSQEAVSEAIHLMRQRLPFPLLGIDSDNGSEFINRVVVQ